MKNKIIMGVCIGLILIIAFTVYYTFSPVGMICGGLEIDLEKGEGSLRECETYSRFDIWRTRKLKLFNDDEIINLYNSGEGLSYGLNTIEEVQGR